MMILKDTNFDFGHVEVDFKIYLTEIKHSVLWLRRIFSRKQFSSKVEKDQNYIKGLTCGPIPL